jgi:hypothetical protein
VQYAIAHQVVLLLLARRTDNGLRLDPEEVEHPIHDPLGVCAQISSYRIRK